MTAIGIYKDGMQSLFTAYLDEDLVRAQFKKLYGFGGKVPHKIIIVQNGWFDPIVLKVIVND